MEEVFKVLHVSTAKSWRGGEQQAANLISQLNQMHIDNSVFCCKGGAFEAHCKEESIDFSSTRRGGIKNLNFAYQLARWSGHKKVDLVHCHDSHSHTAAFMAKLFFGLRGRIIVSRRVDFPIASNGLSYFKYNHPCIASIICVSHAIEAIVRKNLKKPDVACTVHSGVDLNRFVDVKRNDIRKLLGLPSDAFLVGNTSALAPHKDFETFLETAQLVCQQDAQIHFIIVGDGPSRNAVFEKVESLALKDRVHCVGFQQDVGSWLKDFDCFFISSKTEGLGTSIIDAMAQGIPVIATAAGGIPELVINEKTGLLFPIQSPQDLAKGLLRLKSDELLRKELTEGARTHVQHFSFEQTAKNTLGVYRRVLGDFHPTSEQA